MYRSANYTTAGSTTVQLNTVDFDTAGGCNTGSYSYTIPIDGYWFISANLLTQANSGTGYFITVVIDGSEHWAIGNGFISAFTNSGSWTRLSGSGVRNFTAGTVLTLHFVGNTSQTVYGNPSNTNLTGFLVSET